MKVLGEYWFLREKKVGVLRRRRRLILILVFLDLSFLCKFLRGNLICGGNYYILF